mmetsp:Transcript_1053/g.3391  ORF Transcript_1053/g.3391 Transcript_1053/m.3391 type:complete len:221 (+) Transcript_1053:1152-1814(+)
MQEEELPKEEDKGGAVKHRRGQRRDDRFEARKDLAKRQDRHKDARAREAKHREGEVPKCVRGGGAEPPGDRKKHDAQVGERERHRHAPAWAEPVRQLSVEHHHAVGSKQRDGGDADDGRDLRVAAAEPALLVRPCAADGRLLGRAVVDEGAARVEDGVDGVKAKAEPAHREDADSGSGDGEPPPPGNGEARAKPARRRRGRVVLAVEEPHIRPAPARAAG